MGVRVPKDLIQDEQPEYDQRGRKRPEFFANEAPRDEKLCSPMRDQIAAGKVLGVESQAVAPVGKHASQMTRRVMREKRRSPSNCRRPDPSRPEDQEIAGDDLERSVERLDCDGNVEQPMHRLSF